MKDNKGFSLVELIVVVAIMAVLVGILAPAYLSYVEKTRKGADEDAVEEIRRAVENAAAGDLTVYDEIVNAMGASGSVTYTIADGDKINTIGGTELGAALKEVFGEKEYDMKSKAYNGDALTITIKASAGSAFVVEATHGAAAGGAGGAT